jgi:hypothetical protein
MHVAETANQWLIVPGDQNILAARPVASADVQADSQAVFKSGDDAIEQLGGVFKFGTRITAGS